MNALRVRIGWLPLLAIAVLSFPARSQEPLADQPGTESIEQDSEVAERAVETLDAAKETMGSVADVVDQNAKAGEIKAGILNPIYQLAETFAFPTFHWIAFCLMVLGVVSYALQLTLGKLVVLGHAGFSLQEILSDLVGLVISVIGLVLTTQAATENSSFTESAAAVLSSAGVGLVLGFLFYLWGQRQEIEAARGRGKQRAPEEAKQGK